MKKIIILSIAILIISISSITNDLKKKKILVVSYNVENLMDTIDDPIKLDNEFIPISPKNWNTEKYYKKIEAIGKVLTSIDPKHFPDIIALIEVENRTVVEDLIKSKHFSNKNFKLIHFETNDLRGIDVALLYNADIFKELSSCQIPLISEKTNLSDLRQILYTKLLINKDTLHIFVNHWKSRAGGQEKTEIQRIETAKILRNKCDSLLKNNSKANIICMGDFNDTPFDKSLNEYLNASIDSIFDNPLELFNLATFEAKNKNGTHSYNAKWSMIDNIIVSQNLLDKKNSIKAHTLAKPFGKKDINLYYNPKIDDYVPNKTYGGNSYFGGVSDHLPIYFYLIAK